MLHPLPPSSSPHGVQRPGVPLFSKSSGGPGIDRPDGAVDQKAVDQYQSLQRNFLDGTLHSVKRSVKVSTPQSAGADFSSTLRSGLEVSSQLITGVPGAVLKLTSVNDQTVAILVTRGQRQPQLLDVKSTETSAQTSHAVTMPDGSELFIAAKPDASKILLHRTVGDTSLDSEFVRGEEGYQLAGYQLSRTSSKASLGASGLQTDHPEVYLTQRDGERFREARTTPERAQVTSKPRYNGEFVAMESVHTTLGELQKAAQSVYGGIFDLT